MDNPLGRTVAYSDRYDPGVLHRIARADARQPLGIAGEQPFRGTDFWTAYELTWLDARGRPRAAIASIAVPADSSHIVESKSMKLYLNSLAMSRYADAASVRRLLEQDLGTATGGALSVQLHTAAHQAAAAVGLFPGRCIDDEATDCDSYTPDATLLATGGRIVSESLHSHILRSNCPVTGQPDTGSVLVTYTGPRIDAGALLRYIVSFRQHTGFHESCVERMYCEIAAHCKPTQLTVYARYNRRGGIDINPFRSNFEAAPTQRRLWRQ